MCCRYVISRKVIAYVNAGLGLGSDPVFQPGEIRPNGSALMLYGREGQLTLSSAVWGFPWQGRNLIINARSESVFSKPMFSSSAVSRRCVLPAERFFEWDREKNMAEFSDPAGAVMLLAGIWNVFEDGVRFTVLTTAANGSVLSVHDRMPVIIDPGDLGSWLFSETAARAIMAKTPPVLEVSRTAEQLSLF